MCSSSVHLPGRPPGGHLFGDFSRIGGLMFLGVPHMSTGSCIQGTCSPLLRLSVEELVMISKPQARAGYPIFPYGLNQLPPPIPVASLARALGARLCWGNSSNQTYGPGTEVAALRLKNGDLPQTRWGASTLQTQHRVPELRRKENFPAFAHSAPCPRPEPLQRQTGPAAQGSHPVRPAQRPQAPQTRGPATCRCLHPDTALSRKRHQSDVLLLVTLH